VKVVRVLLVIVALLSVWMTYDNVLSDDVPSQALAQLAACTVKKCDQPHTMTRMSKTPIGQSFEYTWGDGAVNVTCRREYFVAGTRVCKVDVP
jgi:hypothetical protein